MFVIYNPHHIRDDNVACIARAFSCAFNKIIKNTDNLRNNWKKMLLDMGFEYVSIPAKPFSKRMTVKQLSELNTVGKTIICSLGDHVVCIKDNNYFDTCDTGDRCVFYYFVKGGKLTYANN
jgi:hypothetical protein